MRIRPIEYGNTLRAARDYLSDWADNARGWLRRYYPPDSDEPHVDLTANATQSPIPTRDGAFALFVTS